MVEYSGDVAQQGALIDRFEQERAGVLSGRPSSSPYNPVPNTGKGRQSQKPAAQFLRNFFGNIGDALSGGTIEDVEGYTPPHSAFTNAQGQHIGQDEARRRAEGGGGPAQSGAPNSPNYEGLGSTDLTAGLLTPDSRFGEALQFMKTSSERLNQLNQQSNLISSLAGEALSPEAQLQVDQLRENTAVEVQRLNEDIINRLGAIDAASQVFGRNEEQMQGTTAASKALLGGTAGGQANASTGGGSGSSVRTAAENTMSGIASELLGPNLGDSGGWQRVEGGAETPQRRAAQAQAMDDSMITLDNAVEQASSESGEPRVGGPSSAEAGAISAAAEAQLDYMGIQDEYTRNLMRDQFQMAMSNEVVNLVRERQDVTRNEEQSLAAIQLDDEMARNDRFGIAETTDPTQIGLIQASDWMQDSLAAEGVDLEPLDEQGLGQLVTQWAQADDASRLDMMDSGPFQNLINRYGLDPQTITKTLDQGASVANRAIKEIQDETRTTFEPNTTGLAYRLTSAASELGLSPEEANDWGNTWSAHQLVNMLSGGNSRYNGGATKRGLFALPEDVYEAAGIPWEEAKNDPNLQMQVGIAVLSAKYGSPQAALRAINESGGLDLEGFRGQFTTGFEEEETE